MSQSPRSSFENVTIRESLPQDATSIYDLIPELSPLDQHTRYTYWHLLSHYSNGCFIAEDHDLPVGFITSQPTETPPDEWFIWQVGILPEYRGRGLVDKLQDRVIEAARKASSVAIRTTIQADNLRSYKVFSRMADRLGMPMVEKERFTLPPLDSAPTPEVLYRIPLRRQYL